MKQNITGAVTKCRECDQYFTMGVEGEGDTCDQCTDDTELPAIDEFDELQELLHNEEAP